MADGNLKVVLPDQLHDQCGDVGPIAHAAPFWDPDQALSEALADLDAAYPATGKWRPLGPHQFAEGFGPAKLEGDR